MQDIINGLYDQAEAIMIATVFLLVIFSVIQTFMRTRSWVPTIGVLLVGAVALWGVNNVTWFGGQVDDTIQESEGGGDATRGQIENGG